MRRPWIKIETATPDKTEICTIATKLRMDTDTVVGKLVRLWSWAELSRVSGNDLGVTKEFIDKVVARKGFAQALEECGWLIESDGKLSFRNFQRHNQSTARVRALTAKRVAKHRQKRQVEQKSNAKIVSKATSITETNETNTASSLNNDLNVINADNLLKTNNLNHVHDKLDSAHEVTIDAVTMAVPMNTESSLPEPAMEGQIVEGSLEPVVKKRRAKSHQDSEDQPMLF